MTLAEIRKTATQLGRRVDRLELSAEEEYAEFARRMLPLLLDVAEAADDFENAAYGNESWIWADERSRLNAALAALEHAAGA